MDEIAQIHSKSGGSYVDTQGFIMEINERVNKLKLRNQTFISLKKHLQFRGSTIEEMFKNIKGLGNYRDESLAVGEFFTVLMSIEFKIELS